MSNTGKRDTLLRRVAKAKSLSEKTEAVNELDAFDRNEREAAATARSIDLADTTIRERFQPVAVHQMNSIETDWMDDFRPEQMPRHAAIAEAAQWFERVSPEVKSDPMEFGIQAEGFMRREASRFGEQADQVYTEGLAYIGTLYRQAASGLDQIQQTVDPHDNPKATPLNPQTYDTFAPEVDPINEGVVGTETSERNPMLQILMQQNQGQAAPEQPSGHWEEGDFSNSYSEVPAGQPMDASSGSLFDDADAPDAPQGRQSTASHDGPSLAISQGLTLDDFRRQAASGLDQIQQTVDPHEDPRPTPLNEQVAFPWMLDEQEEPEEEHREASRKAAFVACGSCGNPAPVGKACPSCTKAHIASLSSDPEIASMAREAGVNKEAFIQALLPLLTRAAPMLLRAAPMLAGGLGGDKKNNGSEESPAQQNQGPDASSNDPIENPFSTTGARKQRSRYDKGGSHGWGVWDNDSDTWADHPGRMWNDNTEKWTQYGAQSQIRSLNFMKGSEGNYSIRPFSRDEEGNVHQASRKQADTFSNPQAVPQPGVANSPDTTPNLNVNYDDGRRDAQDPNQAPTVLDASSTAGDLAQYAKGYSDELQNRPGPENDRPGPAHPNTPISLQASRKFVDSKTASTSDFRKGYNYASKWNPTKPLVRTGSVEFETGLVAGLADMKDKRTRRQWRTAHLQAGGDFAARAKSQTAYLAMVKSAATTTMGLEPADPRMHASPMGQTPMNGVGTVPLLDGEQDAAAPGGPAPYNGAEPFGQSVVPDRAPLPPVPMVNNANVTDEQRRLAFRKRVQASLLKNNQKG